MTWGYDAQVKKELATAQLKVLLQSDVTRAKSGGMEKGKVLLDTARIYRSGEAEGLLGEILKENPSWKSQISIHTKAHPMVAPLNREGLHKQCNGSLKALGVDSVDIYYLHSPDIKTEYQETLSTINELHKAGKFKEWGLSAYASWDVVRIYHLCKSNGWVLPTVYQGIYNAITRSMESELMPALRTYGFRSYWYNPLGAGFLTGRYKSPDELPTEGRFSPQFDISSTSDTKNSLRGKTHTMIRGNYFKKKLFDSLEVVRQACEAERISMASAAIRWMTHHSVLDGTYHDGLLFGASYLQQVEDNIAAYVSGPLPDSIVKAYEEAWEVAYPESASYFRGYGSKQGSSEHYLAKF